MPYTPLPLHDALPISLDGQAFRRIATAIAKYWICKRGPAHAYEALECLGGNGYTEDFPLARRYREQPVRSEEHTSELQSRGHLVCRLLLAIKEISICI